MKSKVLVTTLLLLASLLAARGVSLLRHDWQHDLRLRLVQNDLERHLETLWGAPQAPEVIVDGPPEGTVAGEIEHLWESQGQAEKEHRQKVVELINEQRQVVNEATPEVYPLLELKTHPLLEQSAKKAFEAIAETKRFEHQDMTALLTRGEPFDRVGENLAAENNIAPARTVYDFYLSETHRELVLDDWEWIGVWSGWISGLEVKGEEPADRYVTVVHFGE